MDYYENYMTENDVIGEKMFYKCARLQQMVLPSTVTIIGGSAFDTSGLRSVIIPDKVTTVGHDAFGSSSKLEKVIIGKNVRQLDKEVFYASAVKDAYVSPLTPPNVDTYLFSSNPTIHVYASALEAYQNSKWAEYGTIVGDLTDEIFDAIEEIDDEQLIKDNGDDAIYDLMGRRVSDMKPVTIYIRNGKKFVVK